MQKELSQYLLLVPQDPRHCQQYRRLWWPELEADSDLAGGLDAGLPRQHQGHQVGWEGAVKCLTCYKKNLMLTFCLC